MLQQKQTIMKRLILAAVFLTTVSTFAQYGYRDGNRIGISAGVSQSSLFTNNFATKPDIGYNGGLSIRGNYYNNWSMIYGMQFFVNNFKIETSSSSLQKKETQFSLTGIQVRLLGSYNVVKDHVSLDFGPVLQINGKMSVASSDENHIIQGTLLKANQILDVTTINANFYVGFSAGGKVVRANFFYQYGLNNILNNLNSQQGLTALNGNNKFKGNIGTVSGQIIFNL